MGTIGAVGDLADFEVFHKHVRTRSTASDSAGALIAYSVLAVILMFYWKSSVVGDFESFSLVEQYFLVVDDGELNPIWWILAWSPFVLILMSLSITGLRFVFRRSRLQPLHRSFLDRGGYVAQIRRVGMSVTRRDTGWSSPLAVLQGPHLGDAQFNFAVARMREEVQRLDRHQKQQVSLEYFRRTLGGTLCEASDLFPAHQWAHYCSPSASKTVKWYTFPACAADMSLFTGLARTTLWELAAIFMLQHPR